MLSKSEIRAYLAAEVDKVLREVRQTPRQRALKALKAVLEVMPRKAELRKSASPAKHEITAHELAGEIMAKSGDMAFTAATALCKAAQNELVDLNPATARNPAGSESSIPTIPGGARGYRDLGGDESRARAGDTAAISRLMQSAMKPTVLATR